MDLRRVVDFIYLFSLRLEQSSDFQDPYVQNQKPEDKNEIVLLNRE